MQSDNLYGVIGDPIEHSLSPKIHHQFAAQFGHIIDYQKYHVKTEQLAQFIPQFFDNGGRGLNVTLPHKSSIISLLDKVSDESLQTNSVNTLFINEQGQLVGDTTDGKGLLFDLNNQQIKIENSNILVIGAGGASQSILQALLKAGASVQLLNRTPQKMEQLTARFSPIGNIKIFNPKQLKPEFKFDCVISSISEFNQQLISPASSYIDGRTFAYDLNYGHRAEPFKQFMTSQGVERFSDGIGMLLAQAALSYQIWHKTLPDISLVKI